LAAHTPTPKLRISIIHFFSAEGGEVAAGGLPLSLHLPFKLEESHK